MPAPRQNKFTHIDEFIRILKSLVLDLWRRYPEDATIARMKKRVFLAVGADPLFVVNAVGEYLYEYRDTVISGDSKFFEQRDFSDDLGETEDLEKAQITEYVIPKVREAWAREDSEGQAAYVKTVQDLLYEYLDYRAIILTEGG